MYGARDGGVQMHCRPRAGLGCSPPARHASLPHPTFMHTRVLPLLVAGLALLGPAGAARAAETGIPPLTATPTSQHVPGRFVWGDLFSTDPEASARFYSGVFGWTATPVGTEAARYTVLGDADGPIAGIVRGPAHPGNKDAARWIGYISVADVDKSAAAVTARGGRILAGPRDVPQRGQHAIAIDAAGGVFGLIHATGGDPEDFFPELNHWAWIGLFTREPQASAEFYRDALGYRVVEDTRTERADDYILATDDTARAGVAPLPEGSQYRALWVGFVRVADISASLDAVRTNGGRVLVEPKITSNDLAVAVAEDPFGAVFGLITLNTASAE